MTQTWPKSRILHKYVIFFYCLLPHAPICQSVSVNRLHARQIFRRGVSHTYGFSVKGLAAQFLEKKRVYDFGCPSVSHSLTHFFVCRISLNIKVIELLLFSKKCFYANMFMSDAFSVCHSDQSVSHSVSHGCNLVYIFDYNSRIWLFPENFNTEYISRFFK